ncbi:hypothetical protein D3C80_1448350 [compost metagenome]
MVDLDPGQGCQAVRLQAGAGHQLAGAPDLVVAADGDLVGGLDDGPHGGLQLYFAAEPLDDPGHGFADLLVVDDTGGIEEQAAEADDVRLAPLQFLGIQLLDLQTVLLRTLIEGVHALDFQRRGCHQQLAADVELDLVLGAELLGGLGTALAQVGLEAARGVVDPRVDHATVVAGLVPGEGVFLLQNYQ